MLNSKKFEKFTRYLNKTLPKSICNLTDDLDTKIRTILQNQFSTEDFVKKEEFNIQEQKLLKVQEKLNQLENKLKELEVTYNDLIKEQKKT